MGLVEYTMAPHWFVAVYDAYNYGNHHSDMRIHYTTASVGYMKNSTRIQLSYGKSMEGVICVGGGCQGKNGGFVVTLAQDTGSNDYLIRIGNQYKWFSEDNNWITILPQNGSVDIDLVRISKTN